MSEVILENLENNNENKPDNEAKDTSEASQVKEDQVETKDKPTHEENTSSTKKPNARLSFNWSQDSYDDSKVIWRFSLPSIGLFDFRKKIEEFKNSEIDLDKEEYKEWKKVTEDSIDYHTPGGLYQNRFFDENSEFEQGIKTKEGELKSLSSLKMKQTEGELKGAAAILKVSKALGLGDVLSVPLPHSGIWVTIKPPTEKDLIDFYNEIFKEKIALGRSTYGLTLTNFSVYINMRLFDFILKHIHSINNKDIPKGDLGKYLLIHDFPILVWGFAATMYPNGFDYQRACVNDIEKCTHIVKATLNMLKLLWIDNSSLTEAQKVILSENRPNALTLEHYNKFIAEHVRVSGHEFKVNDSIKIKLRIPNFFEYTTDGLTWVNKINSAIDSLIVENEDENDAKIKLLEQYVRSSILRQFSHFIDFIEVDESVISDRDTINEVLEVFSADDDIRKIITDKILKFKSDTTIALVGIPDYKCPKCGFHQKDETVGEHMTNVIPLDVMNIFFTLITLRISKIMEREI